LSYNLLDERWIPVLFVDGRLDRLGIRRVLHDAHRIRDIATSNPMDRIAVIRFLLALLYWCRGNPTEEAISEKTVPPSWLERLELNRAFFNLLGGGERFYQDSTAKRRRAINDLIQELPTGNNFWHFRHMTDFADRLCPACCSLGLLRLPMFSVSGLPDLKAGINGTPPVYVMPVGKTLPSTLVANWAPVPEIGVPAWVQPVFAANDHIVVPLLTGLTALSRRVWLDEPSGPAGVCANCGVRAEALIRACEFQSAGDLHTDRWTDPHVIYAEVTPSKSSKAQDPTATGRFKTDRPWPELLARLVENRPERLSDATTLHVVGFATDKAKNIDVWERTIPLPSKAQPEAFAETLRQWQKEGDKMAANLARKTGLEMGPGKRRNVEIAATTVVFRPHVEERAINVTVQTGATNESRWAKAAEEYRPVLAVLGKSLAPGTTSKDAERRKAISEALPTMRTPAKEKGRRGGA